MQSTLSCPICENTDLSKPYKSSPQDRMSVDCRDCGLSFYVKDVMADTKRPAQNTKSVLPDNPGMSQGRQR